MERFHYTSDFSVPAGRLFAWHERPGAFDRLNPPWAPVKVISLDAGIKDGARVAIKIPFGPFGIPWLLEHRNYRIGEQFEDFQIQGPFASWSHTHRVESLGAESSRLLDTVQFELPLGNLGRVLKPLIIGDALERAFRYRHTIIKNDLALTSRLSANRPLRILLSGGSGLIGEALESFLGVAGHEVWKLVRRETKTGRREIRWDPERDAIDPESIEGFDAVIHLGGESIAKRRWTPAFKAELLKSRVAPTALLAKTLATLTSKPRVFICASAVGFYGDRGSEELNEKSARGQGFLPELADRWEIVARQTEAAGIRSVQTRFGVVLSPRGGALKKMLPPFLMGAGGPAGDGTQFMSWIAIDDAVGAMYQALVDDKISGPVNFVSPQPVTNREFAKTLGSVLRRPAILPLPRAAIRAVFGEMGETLLLESARVIPGALSAAGYQFLFPELGAALKHQLGRS